VSGKILAFGFVLILAGFVLLFLGSVGGTNVSTGGFVLIGPVPIVFGSGTNGSVVAVLAVCIGLLMLFWFVLLARRAKAGGPQVDNGEEISK
jgi:uncharacterized membrane protein